ncbi:MAG: hypothetical protein AB1489_27860 [Acidobacteriota bacterium]
MSYFQIDTGFNACFSDDFIKLEISFNETDLSLVKCHHKGKEIIVPILQEEAIHFISAVLAAARQEENIKDTNSTTHYYCNFQWEGLSFVELTASGKLEMRSSQMEPELIKEFLEKAVKDQTEIGKRHGYLLNETLHIRPIAIYRMTRKFIEQLSSKKEKVT